MLPRFRSFYGKVIIFILVALCFVLYLKVQPNPSDDYLVPGGAAGRARPAVASALRSRAHENEILAEHELRASATQSPYEHSIQLDLQKQQQQLGNDGAAVHLKGIAKVRGEKIYKKIALNEELSEQLSYNRTVGDHRNPLCKQQQYDDPSTLPTASVVIIFYNEPYSVLVRTVHSTLNTCNQQALQEIILVDDGSDNVELGGKLDHYVRTRLPSGKVTILRLKNR